MNRRNLVIIFVVILVLGAVLFFAKDFLLKKISPRPAAVQTPPPNPNGNDIYPPSHVTAPTTIVIPKQ